jgi:hypothetical protein
VRHGPGAGRRERHAGEGTCDHHRHPIANDERQDAGTGRAKRHADADFRRAARHGEGKRAMAADRRR